MRNAAHSILNRTLLALVASVLACSVWSPTNAEAATVEPALVALEAGVGMVRIDPLTGVKTTVGRPALASLPVRGATFDARRGRLILATTGATSSDPARLLTLDSQTGKTVKQLELSKELGRIAFDPTTNAVVGLEGRRIVRIDPSSGERTEHGRVPSTDLAAFIGDTTAFDPETGHLLVIGRTADADRALVVIDTREGGVVASHPLPGTLDHLAFDAATRTVVGIESENPALAGINLISVDPVTGLRKEFARLPVSATLSGEMAIDAVSGLYMFVGTSLTGAGNQLFAIDLRARVIVGQLPTTDGLGAMQFHRPLTESKKKPKPSTNTDQHVEGDVLAKRCDTSYPVVLINTRDGQIQVVMKQDARNTCEKIEVGDALEADGQQENALLFLADEVNISER